MIGWLRGQIVNKGIDVVLIDVGGVGYEVRVTMRAFESLPPIGEEAVFHVHTNVKEDEIALYGFVEATERKLFRRMISVTGIGPKLALQALGTMTAVELQSALIDRDLARLTQISGVGKKTAQRMIVELGETVAKLDLGGDGVAPRGARPDVLDDVYLALVDLGFPKKKTERTVDQLRPAADDGASVEDLLKEALRLIHS